MTHAQYAKKLRELLSKNPTDKTVKEVAIELNKLNYSDKIKVFNLIESPTYEIDASESSNEALIKCIKSVKTLIKGK